MKQATLIFIIVATILANLNVITFADTQLPTPPKVTADSAVLMDATTGQILYSKNMDAAYPPASTTKMMTALLTLENCKLDDVVTIGNDFTQQNYKLLDGNSISIKDGEQITVKDLLHAMIMFSANDAAVALAVHISGSVPAFAALMNKRAAELGCTSSHFANPNGLYDPNHKVSGKDMALILRELLKHPEFSQIATTIHYTLSPTNKTDAADTIKERSLYNEDKMIYKNRPEYYEGIVGGKTGYTIQSLFSYVACANRNNHTLIVTLIHNPEKDYYDEAKSLFDYGFMNYDLVKLYSKGQKVSSYSPKKGVSIPLTASEDVYYELPKGSTEKPQVSIDKKNIPISALKKGKEVLNATLTFNNQKLETFGLICGTTYVPNTIKSSSINYNIIILIIALILIGVVLFFITNFRKRKKLKGIY